MKTTRTPDRPLGDGERTTVTYTHYYKGFAPHQQVTISDTSGGAFRKETLPANECGIVSVNFPSAYRVQDGVGESWVDIYRMGDPTYNDYIGLAFTGNSPAGDPKLDCSNLANKTLQSDGNGGQFYFWRKGTNLVLYWSKLQPGVSKLQVDLTPTWELFPAVKKLKANSCGVVKFVRKGSGHSVVNQGQVFWDGTTWLINGVSHDWLDIWLNQQNRQNSEYICRNGALYEPAD